MANNPIKEILIKALDFERWAPKSEHTYPFLEPGELEEMADNVMKKLREEGYRIQKIKKKV